MPPESSKQRASEITISRQELFRGPIPPPDVLTEYDRISAGLAERIVSMAEQQAKHRQKLEQENLNADTKHMKKRDKEARIGQIFAFIIAMTAILSAAWVGAHGYQVAASFIGVSGIGGIVGAFIYGRHKDNS